MNREKLASELVRIAKDLVADGVDWWDHSTKVRDYLDGKRISGWKAELDSEYGLIFANPKYDSHSIYAIAGPGNEENEVGISLVDEDLERYEAGGDGALVEYNASDDGFEFTGDVRKDANNVVRFLAPHLRKVDRLLKKEVGESR